MRNFKRTDLNHFGFGLSETKEFKLYDCILGIVSQAISLRLAGFGCLFVSHLTWNNQEAQAIFSTPELLKRLIELADFNELINMGEAEATVESLMEIAFYSLLGLINITMSNPNAQQVAGKLSLVDVLIR